MKIKSTLFALVALVISSVNAQNLKQFESPDRPVCQTPVPDASWDQWFNERVEEFTRNRASGKTAATTYVIPVIVHVIHGGQALGTYPNVTAAQINSEIGVLNSDYAGTGFNVNTVPAPFFSLVANCDISFCLAQLDPNGKCLPEPGIERLNYKARGWSNPTIPTDLNAFKALLDGTIKPSTIWDPSRYLNIWICDIHPAVSLLGYATFPAGAPLTGVSGAGSSLDDGVVIWTRAFGNVGILDNTYNKGRTASHEIGHWLGLRHIWGDNGQCGGTDYCNDTPPQKGGTMVPAGANFGCSSYPLNANTCTISGQSNVNGDMFMNFMDYSDDPCLYMFTPDQRTRMHTAMNFGTYRKDLTQSASTLCGIPAAAPTASFDMSATELTCDDTLKLTNLSGGSPCPAVSWSVDPPTGYTLTLTSTILPTPYIRFNTSGVYTISVEANNASGNDVNTQVVTVSSCPTDGINESELFASRLNLMPNPSSGQVQIMANLDRRENMSVLIYNSLGSLLGSYDSEALEKKAYKLNLSDYAPGIYSFVIQSANQRAVKRLVLSK